jgi:hypothetical protein
LIIDLVLGFRDFGLISLFTAIGLFVTTYSSKKIDPIKIIITLLAVLTTTYNNSEPVFSILILFITTLFFYTVERKIIIAALLTIGSIVGSLYLNNIPILGLLMLVIIILKYAKRHNIFNSFLPITLSFVVLAIIVFPSIHLKPSLVKPNQNNVKIETKTTELSNVRSKEGRDLSFVENPLINQTSKEEFVFTGLSVIGKYLALNFFPYQLSFYYGFSNIDKSNSKTPSSWLSLFSYLIIIGIAIWQAKKQPLMAIGFMWYTASILFFSNWVELVAGVIGERLSYTASAGFSIFICGLVFWIVPSFLNRKNIRVEIVVVFILTLFFIRTMERNALWASPVKLMGHDIEHLSNSAQANNMLAIALMSEVQKTSNFTEKEKLIEKALIHFKKTISIYPKFFNAHVDIARVYIMQGKLNEAKRHLVIAYAIDPKSILVLEELVKINFDSKNLYALINYADQYLELDQKNQLVYELVAHQLFVNSQKSLALKYAKLGLAQFPHNENLLYISKTLYYQNGN